MIAFLVERTGGASHTDDSDTEYRDCLLDARSAVCFCGIVVEDENERAGSRRPIARAIRQQFIKTKGQSPPY